MGRIHGEDVAEDSGDADFIADERCHEICLCGGGGLRPIGGHDDTADVVKDDFVGLCGVEGVDLLDEEVDGVEDVRGRIGDAAYGELEEAIGIAAAVKPVEPVAAAVAGEGRRRHLVDHGVFADVKMPSAQGGDAMRAVQAGERAIVGRDAAEGALEELTVGEAGQFTGGDDAFGGEARRCIEIGFGIGRSAGEEDAAEVLVADENAPIAGLIEPASDDRGAAVDGVNDDATQHIECGRRCVGFAEIELGSVAGEEENLACERAFVARGGGRAEERLAGKAFDPEHGVARADDIIDDVEGAEEVVVAALHVAEEGQGAEDVALGGRGGREAGACDEGGGDGYVQGTAHAHGSSAAKLGQGSNVQAEGILRGAILRARGSGGGAGQHDHLGVKSKIAGGGVINQGCTRRGEAGTDAGKK